MPDGCLSGVRILEHCELVAGPYCTKLMADLGAEVIKIEPPGCGDSSRGKEPFLNDVPHPERSGLFLWLNTNKLGITLNINNRRGREIFNELVKETDVLVVDKEYRELEKLKLDYTSLKEINPRLILTTITPFGLTGPYRDYKAYHLNTFHAGGEGYFTPGGSTFTNRPPLKAGRYVADYISGINAAAATLVALYWRNLTGTGQQIDISKQEALLMLDIWELSRWASQGVMTTRFTRGWRLAGPMQCKDGYIEFAPQSDEEWLSLDRLLGNPEWTKDESLKTRVGREEHGDELKKLMTPWFMQHRKEEIYHEAQKLGCPISPYYRPDELTNSPQLGARQFFAEIEHPETGKLKYPSAPYKFSKTPWAIKRPAPTLGEHNVEIYCQRLNYKKTDLVKLRETGAI